MGRPLCPCRFYPDKAEEVRRRTWLCACDDMRRYKYCHCLLFVRPDGLPVTEHLPEGHAGREAWGLVADPTPGTGRESGRSGKRGRGPDMGRAGPLYLEDFAVGQTFRSGTAPVELGEVRAFAAAFDPQPFHLDEQEAGSSVFGGLVASGWHTAALTMRLLVEGDLQVAGGLVGAGVESIRWPRPVPGRHAPRRERGAGGAPVAVAARPGRDPGAEHDVQPGRPARDGAGRRPDRPPPSGVRAGPGGGRSPSTRRARTN